MPVRLTLTILGVDISLRIEDGCSECADLLRGSYGLLVREGDSDTSDRVHGSEFDGLEASICSGRVEGTYRTRVEGKEVAEFGDPIDAVRSLNHELLHAIMLRASRYFYVHAGVVARGGRTLVMPGLSRAGKSTLVLAMLLRGGWEYLSDELLVYDRERNAVGAFARSLKVREVCLPYFEGLEDQTVGRGEGRFLSPEALSPDARRIAEEGGWAGPVSMIVAPRWQGNGKEVLTAMGTGEALLSLTSSALNFGTHREGSLDHLTALVSGARAFRLSWSHPGAAAERIEGVFETHPETES